MSTKVNRISDWKKKSLVSSKKLSEKCRIDTSQSSSNLLICVEKQQQKNKQTNEEKVLQQIQKTLSQFTFKMRKYNVHYFLGVKITKMAKHAIT